ncbi:hypothetical protein FA950_30100 [Bacillus thuringiensis]|uniref:hypothetical protein n=1 Tax=Bacillus thuringiensis TaxID=1428 RepID=UPI0010ACB75A|nr:hypothetical protein [Bacillus thuringiensis]TJZ99679.1 hypothetical protein FA950_30100 [Bacillus thuringiensis]
MSKGIKWRSSLFIMLAINSILCMPTQADQRNVQNKYSTQEEYLYMGVIILQLQDMFQQNGRVYYRLSSPGAMDAPDPVALPPHIGEKYLIRPGFLQGWVIQTYMKQKEISSGRWVQERKLDFYNQFRQYQGTAYHQYIVPYK